LFFSNGPQNLGLNQASLFSLTMQPQEKSFAKKKRRYFVGSAHSRKFLEKLD
jgi:hypothetical protein